MTYKTKSLLYFASLVVAVATYYAIDNTDTLQNTEVANHTLVQVSSPETLN